MSSKHQNGTELTIEDVEQSIMPLLATMYPDDFEFGFEIRSEGWNRRVALWHRQLAKYNFDKYDILDALEFINANSDYNKIPSIAKVIAQAKIEQKHRSAKQGKYVSRIQTPEEVLSDEYIEIMQDIKQGRRKMTDDTKEYLLKIKKYFLLFNMEGWEERYEAYFGKKREEFEHRL